MYADYTYYTTTYQGAAIPAASYDALSIRAMWYVDSLIKHQTNPGDAVKMASCAVAEVLFDHEQSGGVSHETVGRHSVTYASQQEKNARLYEAAYSYLCNTGLLYRAVPVLW